MSFTSTVRVSVQLFNFSRFIPFKSTSYAAQVTRRLDTIKGIRFSKKTVQIRGHHYHGKITEDSCQFSPPTTIYPRLIISSTDSCEIFVTFFLISGLLLGVNTLCFISSWSLWPQSRHPLWQKRYTPNKAVLESDVICAHTLVQVWPARKCP